MGVYVKGMEMPRFCDECNIKAWDGEDYVCPFSGIPTLNIGRQNNCPLIEIPEPHGDLIDVNALKIAVMSGDCDTRIDFLRHTMDCINNAPTVIPASNEAE